MIRVKGNAPPPPAEPELPPMPPEPPMEAEQAMPAKMSMDKVDPMVAVYRTPDMGPFMCSNCHFFEGESSCSIVSGPIDPEGVCNMFSAGDPPAEDPSEPMPEGEPYPPEAPPEGLA